MASIVWHSVAPWSPSAFGGQTRLMVRSLRALGHQVVLSADSGLLGETEWEGHRVVGSPGDVHEALSTWVHPLVDRGEVDLVVTCVDGFRLATQGVEQLPAVSWLPVHTDPAEDEIVAYVRRSGARPVADSRFGAAAMERGGLRQVDCIPHGVDLATYRPLVPGDRQASRAEARARLGLPAGSFVVGFVGTNVQPLLNRKSIPELMIAVGRLAERYDDVCLYLHTDVLGRWMNGDPLPQLAGATGADRAQILGPDEMAVRNGLPDADMAVLYNSFDVLCAPSAAEGFCLPLIEAQACGVPVVASDSSGQRENVGAGWRVGGQRRWHAPDRRWWFTPWIEEIEAALDTARTEGDGLFDAAQAFAAPFDHDVLFREQWLPLLTDVLGTTA